LGRPGGAANKMYLSDKSLRELLPELSFETDDRKKPFDPDSQIQPCSIDLRLDRVFWRQRRGRKIDLRKAHVMELQPHRHWEKKRLNDGESIILPPRGVLLARTFEKFRIPPGYAGKLEGRSSFSRMGLAIHGTGDFINPGYGGRMPLQFVNFGTEPIVLVPSIPICQLIVIKLDQPSERVYGDRELYSKYMNDDGGPSYWWRDKRIEKLHSALGRRSLTADVQKQVLEMIGGLEIECIERFEVFFSALKQDSLTNADDLLDQFAVEEVRSEKNARFLRILCLWLGPAFLSVSLGSPLARPIGRVHYAIWTATAVTIAVSAWAYFWGAAPGEYLTTKFLQKIRSEKT